MKMVSDGFFKMVFDGGDDANVGDDAVGGFVASKRSMGTVVALKFDGLGCGYG